MNRSKQEHPFLPVHILDSAKALILEGARSKDGILARSLNRKVTSSATQGTVSISLSRISALTASDREYLLGTFDRMSSKPSGTHVAWDTTEHRSVWATARTISGIMAIIDQSDWLDGWDVKITHAIQWLIAQKNQDGGFAFQIGLQSRTVYTYFVMQALIDVAQKDFCSDALRNELEEQLKSASIFLRAISIDEMSLWPDKDQKIPCAMSTLFAVFALDQLRDMGWLPFRRPPATQAQSIGFIQDALLVADAFHRFAGEPEVNWSFEEFIPGRLPILLEYFKYDNPVVQKQISWLNDGVLTGGGYCGWGYEEDGEPITWITALALEAVYSSTKSFLEFRDSNSMDGNMIGAHRRIPEKVFIVHGHDEGAKQAVARFIEKIGLQAIILHEQVSSGRTIIEKIEANRDVGFAVILLTPDDFGGTQGAKSADRARQNVVLELGYFMGALGRNRVFALKKGDVEVPSDYSGVVYDVYEPNGAWQQTLAKELSAAGFDIDFKKAFS